MAFYNDLDWLKEKEDGKRVMVRPALLPNPFPYVVALKTIPGLQAVLRKVELADYGERLDAEYEIEGPEGEPKPALSGEQLEAIKAEIQLAIDTGPTPALSGEEVAEIRRVIEEAGSNA